MILKRFFIFFGMKKCDTCGEEVFEDQDGVYVCKNGHVTGKGAFSLEYQGELEFSSFKRKINSVDRKRGEKTKQKEKLKMDCFAVKSLFCELYAYSNLVVDRFSLVFPTIKERDTYFRRNKLRQRPNTEEKCGNSQCTRLHYPKGVPYSYMDLFENFVDLIGREDARDNNSIRQDLSDFPLAKKLEKMTLAKDVIKTAYFYYHKLLYENSFIRDKNLYHKTRAMTDTRRFLRKSQLFNTYRKYAEEEESLIAYFESRDIDCGILPLSVFERNFDAETYQSYIREGMLHTSWRGHRLYMVQNFALHLYTCVKILRKVDAQTPLSVFYCEEVALKYFDFIVNEYGIFDRAAFFLRLDNSFATEKVGKICAKQLDLESYVVAKAKFLDFYRIFSLKQKIFLFDFLVFLFLFAYSKKSEIILNIDDLNSKTTAKAKHKSCTTWKYKIFTGNEIQLDADGKCLNSRKVMLNYFKNFRKLLMIHFEMTYEEFNIEIIPYLETYSEISTFGGTNGLIEKKSGTLVTEF